MQLLDQQYTVPLTHRDAIFVSRVLTLVSKMLVLQLCPVVLKAQRVLQLVRVSDVSE